MSRLRGLTDPRTARIAAAAALTAAVVLYFSARSPLWLDEAQTVWIAHQPLSHLVSSLKQDGAPPLFYVLLHGWMAVFGTGTHAVRALPAVFAVITLPVVWLLAKRVPLLRTKPWLPVLLIGTCPFVIRYASEARMYTLVLLLVVLGMLVFERAWTVGGAGWTIGAGVVAGALLLTQYWSLYLLAIIGLAAIIATIKGHHAARRIVVALLIGAAIFAPWLPTFAYQSAHTGAPWGSPPSFDVILLAVTSWATSGLAAPWLWLSYYALIVIALLGSATGDGVRLGLPARRVSLALVGVSTATLLLAAVASQLSHNAYAPRYSMVILPFTLFAIAIGLTALPARLQRPVVAVLCALGLLAAISIPFQNRTQAGAVAQILRAQAAPGDLVVICPDQLGPAIHRLAPDAGTQVVYPDFATSAMVDWVDYKSRMEGSDPSAFVQSALSRAGGRPIWLVSENGYPTLHQDCADVFTDLTAARGRPAIDVTSSNGSFESEQLARFPAGAAP